jgi:hypothetical protein
MIVTQTATKYAEKRVGKSNAHYRSGDIPWKSAPAVVLSCATNRDDAVALCNGNNDCMHAISPGNLQTPTHQKPSKRHHTITLHLTNLHILIPQINPKPQNLTKLTQQKERNNRKPENVNIQTINKPRKCPYRHANRFNLHQKTLNPKPPI